MTEPYSPLIGLTTWSPTRNYAAGDFVINAGSIWQALRGNCNIVPIDGADWSAVTGNPNVARFGYDTATVINGTNVSWDQSLTAVVFPYLTTVDGIFALDDSDMAGIVSISAPVLTSIGAELDLNQLNYLTSLSFPLLETVNLFQLNGLPLLTSMNFPSLRVTTDSFDPNILLQLTSIQVDALEEIGGDLDLVDAIPLLPSFSAPALTTVTGSVIVFGWGDGDSVIASIVLPSIETIGGGISAVASSGPTPFLVTFTLGATLKSVGSDVIFTSCALNEASVDALLVRLAALDGTGGTTSYDGHLVTITGTSSPPSAVGLTAKGVLEAGGRGNTVTVNS